MQKTNLNLVIFDDQQQPSNVVQIHKYTSSSKNSKPSNGNHHHSEKNIKKEDQNSKGQIISKQIAQLQRKIKSLQKQSQKVNFLLQKKNQPSNIGQNNTDNTKNLKDIEQVLLIVQKKIQLIIQQSKKLLGKMNETMDRRFSQLVKDSQNQNININNSSQKYKTKINQLQAIFKQKIVDYEKHYKNEYEKIVKQSKRKEEVMMKKLSQIQLKFMNKLNTFETKEKQYVDWIHHLQAKLKDRKSKKMITITQQKPQLTSLSSKIAPSNQNAYNQSNLQNLPSANFPTSNINCSIDQNNSRAARKHKIFGQKSVSPAPKTNRVTSPTKDSQQMQGQSKLQSQASHSSFNQISSKPGQMLNFYNDIKKQSNIKQSNKYGVRQNQGWDKFADLNQFSQEYTQTQSDDFFTPIDAHERNYERVLANIPLDSRGGTYYGQFKNQKSYQDNPSYQQGSQKVFSPFDLN